MPRVITGIAKGRRLATLAGATARPTADRVKEALFAVLESLVPAAYVLDLCAGSGGLGIEALSRGARFCTFVESAANSRDVIKANLEKTGLASYARVLPMAALDAIRVLAQERTPAPTVVLADPPYADRALAAAIVNTVGSHALLAPAGVLSVERPRGHDLPLEDVPGLEFWQVKRYGRTSLVLYRAPETTG